MCIYIYILYIYTYIYIYMLTAQDKPRHIVNSLEEFLIPGALEKLDRRIDEEKLHCASLANRARPPKPRGSKSAKSQAKANKAQEKREAKEAKSQLASLSQKLVLGLVKMIEDEKMLKPAMSFPKSQQNQACDDLLDIVSSFVSEI